ncbi:MAG: RES family NAD+ phosphorylase [Enhydrobacter sp.]|nr:MAG: RES family NAD+ phosphorylase [Enhydrobacter sp.]
MDIDYSDCQQVKARLICSGCIGESYLKNEVATHGQPGRCHYCYKDGTTFTIGQVSERVETAFEQNFARSSEGEGESTVYAIMGAADIPEAAAEDIQQVLEYEHEPAPGDYIEGEESEFNSELFYAEHSDDGAYWHERWREFEKTLKTEARYFSQTCESRLKDVFAGIEAMKTKDQKTLIVDGGPGTGIDAFYRARVIEGDDALKQALERPDRHIGPPPPQLAKDGRMNARGISVFYGSGDTKTALAEVRPPVGANVVTAKFRVIRPLRLLDLTILRSVEIAGSLFDPTFAPTFERVAFLRSLSSIMTQPVLPTDEAFAYLATQAVADFLASRADPAIDGILFPSAQTKSDSLNVVLFQKAARVKPLDLPDGTKLRTSLMDYSDGIASIDYRVHEEVPPPKSKPDFSLPEFIRGPWYDPNGDNRDETLEVDTGDVAVHRIHHVSYDTSDSKVSRHRHQHQGFVPHTGKAATQEDIDRL